MAAEAGDGHLKVVKTSTQPGFTKTASERLDFLAEEAEKPVEQSTSELSEATDADGSEDEEGPPAKIWAEKREDREDAKDNLHVNLTSRLDAVHAVSKKLTDCPPQETWNTPDMREELEDEDGEARDDDDVDELPMNPRETNRASYALPPMSNTLSIVSNRRRSSLGMENVPSIVPTLSMDSRACTPHPEPQPTIGGLLRGSQLNYASPDQTVVIFDYDDTLFPTTWLRDDLGVPWMTPLKEQQAQQKDSHMRQVYSFIVGKLAACETEAEALLRVAKSHAAGVLVVTLAKRGWVDLTSSNFTPKLGAALKELKIPILYAREYMPKVRGLKKDPNAAKRLSAEAKGSAIADGLRTFYKQYEGQTWKNIVSIGDSEFERIGTQTAIQNYFKEKTGAENKVDLLTPSTHGRCESGQLTPTSQVMKTGSNKTEDKMLRVRCKTVTLLENPTVEEVMAQCTLIRFWMKALVERDRGLDVRLTESSTDIYIQQLHRELTGTEPGREVSWRVLGGLAHEQHIPEAIPEGEEEDERASTPMR